MITKKKNLNLLDIININIKLGIKKKKIKGAICPLTLRGSAPGGVRYNVPPK